MTRSACLQIVGIGTMLLFLFSGIVFAEGKNEFPLEESTTKDSKKISDDQNKDKEQTAETPKKDEDDIIGETGNDEKEEPPAKSYNCPKCGFSNDEAGSCPACNEQLAQEKEEDPKAKSSNHSGSRIRYGGDGSAIEIGGDINQTSSHSGYGDEIEIKNGDISVTSGSGESVQTGGSAISNGGGE